ncbi:MAG TPA: hypothetical protein DCK95_10210 [Anaerolineaceae bacterium]|nr:hypothetical protein [Anaerolineaceae bacterium]
MSHVIIEFEHSLSPDELKQVQEMNTPYKIQEFLDSVIYPAGEENRSPVDVLRRRQAHCLDGGLFAAALLRRIGYLPLIVDLQPEPGLDDDHVLAVFKEFDCWGAVAKSNFSGLRYREPVYATVRELALSYFNDFFNIKSQKTLRTYTTLINLETFDDLHWMTKSSGVDAIEIYLKSAELTPLISPEQAKYLSIVDERSFRAGTLGINPEGVYKPD